MTYARANTDWLAACRYGIGFHWTAQTVPRHGEPRAFEDAVEAFKLSAFIDAIEYSGADYVIFTVTHVLQKLPCPNAAVDALLPGRTTRRDLIGEMADELGARGKHFIAYYNHSVNRGEDPQWERAVGYHEPAKERFAANLCDIVADMGERYRRILKGYWFDSSYSLDPRGPHNAVSTDLHGFQFPWERWTAAAKRGWADRLVTFNAGIGQTFLYTDHQDYWAGELVDLDHPPQARYLKNGLQWHGWARLDESPVWFHREPNTDAPPLRYSDEQLVRFLAQCNAHQAAMGFNVTVFQDGEVSLKAVEQLHRVGEKLRPAGVSGLPGAGLPGAELPGFPGVPGFPGGAG